MDNSSSEENKNKKLVVPSLEIDDNFKLPIPSSSSSSKNQRRLGDANLLGSDLVPTRSEFTLKRYIEESDRGRPMIDWIRKQGTEKIIIKSPAQIMSVKLTDDDLKLHATKKDAYMALRGIVYNVTDYIPFHPGGIAQIMKGIGKDGTPLFNSVHRYVNFEQILKGKEVGVYVSKKRGSFSEEEGSHLVTQKIQGDSKSPCPCFSIRSSKSYPVDDLAKVQSLKIVPTMNFKENDKFIYYKINVGGAKDWSEEYWSASILSKELLMLKIITTPPDIWLGYYKLKNTLQNDTLQFSFSNAAKTLTLTLEKPKAIEWKSIGEALPESNQIIDSRRAVEDMHDCTMILRKEIAKNMFLIGIEVAGSARIGCPVGFDVKITAIKEGLTRKYTPISLIFHSDDYSYDTPKEVLYFIIKLYSNGSLTPHLCSSIPLHEPNYLSIGSSSGTFSPSFLQSSNCVYVCMGAGSGITPFFKILEFFKKKKGEKRVALCYWSRTEEELVWVEELRELSNSEKWFYFYPVLTSPDESKKPWKGKKGRISAKKLTKLIEELQVEKNKKSQIKFIICGPTGFNNSVCDTIREVGYSLDSTFIFLG